MLNPMGKKNKLTKQRQSQEYREQTYECQSEGSWGLGEKSEGLGREKIKGP